MGFSYGMGIMTISVDDEVERKFRAFVKEKYGTGKGVLGRAIAESIEKTRKENEQEEIKERLRAILKKGLRISTKGMKLRREDMYADRVEKHMPR